MRALTYALIIAFLYSWVPLVGGHDQEPQKVQRQKADPRRVQELMHKKLDYTQKLLAAIVMNDADNVALNADALVRVSKEAEWNIFNTPQYEMNSEDFRRSAAKMARQAKEKDLEGVKLTYLEMTMTCFHCHRYVRDVGTVKAPPAGEETGVRTAGR
jgi:hypothetical protein